MKRKAICKAIIAIAVTMAFVMPVTAFANIGIIGVTSNSENNSDMENMVESTTNSDNSDNIETTIDVENPVIDTEESTIVNDAIVSATGNIIYVGGTGPNNYSTIQEGINAAADGDTVYVYNGTYNEQVTVNKTVDLIGESRENVTVNGGGSGKVVTVTVNNVNITTFSITKGQYGIYSSGSSNNIIDCNIYDQYVYNQNAYGIYLDGSSGSNIINCDVYDNSGGTGWLAKPAYGIYLDGSSDIDITNCDVYDNSGKPGHGIYLDGSSDIDITNCDVYNNYGEGFYANGHGIYLKSSSGNKITNCNIYDNDAPGYGGSSRGIYLEGSSNIDIIDCKIYDNRPSVTNSYGIYSIGSSNNNKIINCEIYDNGCFGIRFEEGASSTFIENCYVHDNNNGVYPVTLGTGIFLIKSPNSKILNSTVTYHNTGISISSNAPTNILIDNCTVYNNRQGFSTTSDASGNTITNCHVYNNTGYPYGEGLWISSSSNTIAYCNVHGNNEGISIWQRFSSGNTVTNCDIYNNAESGIYLRGQSQTITNCNIYNNDQYGIYSDSYSDYETSNNNIENCNIYDNDNYGIYFGWVSNCDIISCNVYNNGYGIYLESSLNCYLNKNAIYDNAGNFGVDGTEVSHFYHDINPWNTVNGKPIWYLVDMENVTIDYILNMGFLALVSCANITVKNSDIIGVIVIDTTDSTLSNISSHDSAIGIYVWLSSNIDMINCDVYSNKEQGIYVLDSSGINITNCEVYDNSQHGIYIEDSSNNTLSGNTLYDNVYNFDLSGTTLDHYIHDIDLSNTVDGKLIYYLIQQSNLTLDETNNIGYLGLVSCWNITAKNSDVTCVLAINTTDSTLLNISSHSSATNGIYVWMSPDCSITNCDAYNNINYGIYASSSPGTTIENCNTYDNYYGITLMGSPDSVITNCTTDNPDPPISTYHNRGIYLSSSDNSSVVNCDITYSRYGLGIYESSDCTVIGCTVYDTHFGIQVSSYSHNNIITDCDVYNIQFQSVTIRGRGSSERNINNTVINCDLSNSGTSYVVHILYTEYTSVINCTIHDAPSSTYGHGIYFEKYNDYATVMGCTIWNNAKHGIYLTTNSNNNKLYHNNLVGNNKNAYDVCSNTWDDGYPSGGNYWSDYTGVDNFSGPGQNISGPDGIGDTPYSIPGGSNIDRYPRMYPIDSIPPVITDVIATPDVQNTTLPVNITCTVTDNWDLVDTVKINITGPEGFTLEATMNEGSNYYYKDIYPTIGIYYYYIWADDAQGNIGVSDTYTFVIIEFDKPISSVDPLPLWKKTVPFTVEATAYDNTGVDSVTLWYRYSSNGTSWTDWTSYGTDEEEPWSWSFTGVDGYYEFYSIAVDDYGNVEDPPITADTSTGIDTVPPVTTITLAGTMGENNWYTSNCVNVTLSATDNLSGVESTWYKVDTGYWVLYTGLFTVCGEGIHTVAYFSIDRAGNIEDTKTEQVKIDITAPITTCELDGLIGSQGWYVSNVTVTLSASDATSGVNYTKYKLDEGAWMDYTGPFDVTEDGEYTLYYYSVDLAGNTEMIKEVEFKIEHDVTPPVTTCEFDGIMGENNWFISIVTVTLSAEDDSAGVDYIMYKLDDDDWENYTGIFIVTEDAEHTLLYYSVDKVGNVEPVQNVTLKIDQTKPIINLTVEKIGALKWLLTADVSDETSGVAKVEFYLDGELLGNITEPPYEWEWSGTGSHTARAIVYDNAGNQALSDEKPISKPSSSSTSLSQIQISSSASSPLFSWLFGLWC